MDVVSEYLLLAFIFLLPVGHVAATVPKNETVVYFFDTVSDVVAVKMGGICYVSEIANHDASELHSPDKIQHYEISLLELISLHQGHHKLMTNRELSNMSGTIAHDCQTALQIYRISDPYNVLGPLPSTVATTQAYHPQDCYELQKHGVKTSGTYMVYPTTLPQGALVYCDMETDGGGWMVFQRRIDGLLSFQQNWDAYRSGFGNLSREFWLGNSIIHSIVTQHEYTLRMEFESFAGEKRFAEYGRFYIEDEDSKYKLTMYVYSGDAGDKFTASYHMKFSTQDSDNDASAAYNCASFYGGGGWWYTGSDSSCFSCNLNGPYTPVNGYGIDWEGFSTTMKNSEMKTRPRF